MLEFPNIRRSWRWLTRQNRRFSQIAPLYLLGRNSWPFLVLLVKRIYLSIYSIDYFALQSPAHNICKVISKTSKNHLDSFIKVESHQIGISVLKHQQIYPPREMCRKRTVLMKTQTPHTSEPSLERGQTCCCFIMQLFCWCE